MTPTTDLSPATRRWLARRFAWITVGLVVLLAAVGASSYAGRRAIVDAQRAGCMRSTADRIAEAREAAADGLREEVLAALPGSGRVVAAHERSAREAALAAYDLIDRSGIADVGDLEQLLATVRADAPTVVAQRRRFCTTAFPSAGVLPFSQPHPR